MAVNRTDLDLAYSEYTSLLREYQKIQYDYNTGDAGIKDVINIIEKIKRQERVIKGQ